MSHRSLIEYLETYQSRGNDVAIAQRRGYRMERWSYAHVAEAAAQFARELESRQIGIGARVLLWGENSAEWVIAFLGCLLRGAVAVPMDRIAAPEFVLRVAGQVDAKLLVTSKNVPPLGLPAPVIALEDLPRFVAGHSSARYLSPALSRSDNVEIVFTSGTTAEPKGVVISHGNLLANIEPLEAEIRKYLRYERFFHPIRFLNLLPLSHVFGQMLGIFLPELLGGTVLFLDSLGPSEVVRTIRNESVSVLVTVPRLAEALRDKVERDLEGAGELAQFRRNFERAANEGYFRRWWRFRRLHRKFGWRFWALICGGAALPADVEQFWVRLAFGVIQGYGMTETASLIRVNHPFHAGRGSIGKAIPGLEVRLDENSEILVRGENVAKGYWREQVLDPVVGPDGWFHTGDLGEFDEKGNLYFRGRRKNVIVTAAGMKIFPEDLETELRKQWEVRDCAVVEIEREANAEPCAVLLLRDRTADARAVIERVNHRLASYQHIGKWVVWPDRDFPRTPTHKPRLAEIKAFVESKLGTMGVALTAEHPGTGLLREFLSRAASAGKIAAGPVSSEVHLETDLNLNSVDRVELMSAIEDRYQIDLNEKEFAEASTVGDLERLVRNLASEPTNFAYPRWPQRWPITWIRLASYYLLVWPATYLLAAPRIYGREKLRDVRAPVLLVSNHISMVDVGYILAALPARLRHHVVVAMEGERLRAMQYPSLEMAAAARWLERVKYVLVVALFNVFPLPQKSGFRESFAFAGESVDRGYNLLVFPEGGRTKDGCMAPFRAGIGLLATGLGLPVIPMRIEGLFALRQAHAKTARPGTVRVAIGEPVSYPPGTEAAQIARDLGERVASLPSSF